MTKIHLEIERLVLDGLSLDTLGGNDFRKAIEAELTRQLQQSEGHELFRADLAVDHLSCRTIQWHDRSGFAALGTQLGESIAKGLGPR